MSIGITSRVAVQRLNQHHRRHYRRPQLLSPEGSDQRHGSLRSRRETRQAAAVEHQHRSADPVERSIPHASCDCVRSGLLALTRLSDFGDQLVEVPVGLGECVLSLQLGPKCDLEKLGGWKVALLQLIVEVFGKIHLNAWHTPNYTPASQRISTSNAHMPTRPIAALLRADTRPVSAGVDDVSVLDREWEGSSGACRCSAKRWVDVPFVRVAACTST